MTTEQTIIQKLQRELLPTMLTVENESHAHNVRPGSQTHFKVVAVSDQFNALTLVKRHQLVYSILKDELEGGVHALALHLFTHSEWQKNASTLSSPDCMGGSKK